MRNFEFEELIERAFSIGYECALEDLEEQREFSEKEDKPKKLSNLDKMDIWRYKNLYGKKSRKGEIERLDEKESIGKSMARSAKYAGKLGAAIGAIGGGLGGYFDSRGEDTKERIKKMLQYGAVGGIGYGAIAGGVVGLGEGLATPIRRSLRKKSSKYDEFWKKEQDKMRVADGQMTREEFLEKWG
jgi:hypothetical protein